MPGERKANRQSDQSTFDIAMPAKAAPLSMISSELVAPFERAQRVASRSSDLNFARVDSAKEGVERITISDLHRYISASSRLWQLENDGEQIPQSQIDKELKAITHWLRAKAVAIGIAPPKHPIPIALPAAVNRLDHVTHRDSAALIDHLKSGVNDLCENGLQDKPESVVIGVLCTSFAFQCGVLNLHEQRALLRSLNRPIHATGKWWHVDLQLTSGRDEALELRRVFLHPYPLAVLIACRTRLQQSDRRAPDRLATESDAALNRIMNASAKALARALHVPRPNLPTSLDSILEGEAALQRVTGLPLVEAYARRDSISHSPPLPVFRRWHGLAPYPDSSPKEEGGNSQPSVAVLAGTQDGQPEPIAADLEAQLKRLRQIFGGIKERKDRKDALHAFTEDFRPADSMRCLIDFGMAMVTGKNRRGRAQKGISVSHLLRDLGPAWLQSTENLNLNTLTQQDIEAVCESVLERNNSPQKRGRIVPGLKAFLHFLEGEGYLTGLDLPDIPRAIGLLAVSANLPTPAEAGRAAAEMAHVSSFASENERLAASAMVQIAAACGMRRNEILHLRVGDLHWGSGGTVEALIRPNVDRKLKSAGSTRVVPLDLAPRDARDRLKRFGAGNEPETPIISAALGATEATYEWRFFPEMNRALKESLADKGFHFHHLRHGAATWLLLSLLSQSLKLDRYADRANYIADAIKTSARDKILLTGNAGPSRKALFAVSSLLGHSSPQITLEHYVHCLDLLLHAQYDTSYTQSNTKQLVGLLQLKKRTAQRWFEGGPTYVMQKIEREFGAHFLRDERSHEKFSATTVDESDSPSLFMKLEQQWLRVSREQARRDADPGRAYRPPNPLMGQIIDALAEVSVVESDKRGSRARTHRFKRRQHIELPPQLRSGRPRQTAILVSAMFQHAFMDDFRKTRDAVVAWGQHTSKVRGFFRLNAANEGMNWLLESGHLDSAWYEWGNEKLNPLPQDPDARLRCIRPPDATHFRLTHPEPLKTSKRTERAAIWWVLSMTYALVQARLL